MHVFPGTETIDAARAYGSVLGHSYYRRGSAVMEDLQRLIAQRQGAASRAGLVRVEGESGRYWRLNTE